MAVPGSSPLARGLLLPAHGEGVLLRIIPARAGFTITFLTDRLAERDHPRSRGVYPPARPSRILRPGSSPLARGLHRLEGRIRCARRIIPARAGFTRRSPVTSVMAWDHPRSRGVYASASPESSSTSGSSPLARGLPPTPAPLALTVRIIPARAGFTPHLPALDAGRADHPRSRGVYTRCIRWPMRWAGSSPLARGLPLRAMNHNVTRRIIPARAGFTGSPG